MSKNSTFSQPFDVLWRTALVKLPRAVPSQALYLTSPEGPQPIILKLRSRGKHEIPLYIFIPYAIEPSQADKLPVVIDFHGGGFFQGSCLEQAPFCSKMARDLSAVVISVDYRMGPMDTFPAALEDAEDVLSAVLHESNRGYAQIRNADSAPIVKSLPQIDIFNLDRSRIAISGFSSGGNLALNLGMSCTDPVTGASWPSVFPDDYSSPIPLILYYPAVDLRQLPSERTKPPNLPVSSPFWSDVNDKLAPTYLPREKASHPRASPGLIDVRKGLHPMARIQLVLSGLDDLLDQNEIWTQKVRDAGRGDDLVVEKYDDMQHGWTQMPDQMLSRNDRKTKEDAYDKTVNWARSIWDGIGGTGKAG
ncbi:alpha/beta-hydrolase [Tothia fuscella]|uniref:Alpha/beta-hydrolase n=1 Tax=Tothia fuscella TaxID=1048955 RepID=A0A9P4TW37_9PEZI|nr:alpha/beta-hydrolase [Tothia fuscella]